MVARNRIEISEQELAEICRRYHVKELALFGSVLRNDFHEDSDIDVLVEFMDESQVGFFQLARLQRELTAVFGRHVDVVQKRGLHSIIRKPILETALMLYEI